MRRLLLLVLLVGCAPLQASDPSEPAGSRPHDPDLTDAACPDGPAPEALVAALPTYVKELVVLWPRGGCTADGQPAARLTVVNHQGEVLTLTAVAHPKEAPPDPRDYRVVLDDGVPRAVLEWAPSADHPHIHVRIAGSPATPRDGLEGSAEFLDLGALVAAVHDLL